MIVKPPKELLLPTGTLDLGQVLDAVGRARFGAEWTGEEADALPVYRMSDYDLERRVEAIVELEQELNNEADDGTPPADPEILKATWRKKFRSDEDHENAPRLRRDAVVTEMRRALRAGKLAIRATAVSGRSETVPPELWAGTGASSVFETGVVYIRDRQVLFSREGKAERAFVTLDKDDLDTFLSGASLATTPQSTARGLKQCQEWLEAEMQASPSRNPRGTKPPWLKEAQEHFKVTGRGFDTAWRLAIQTSKAAAWSRAGRRS